VELAPAMMEDLAGATGCVLGTASRTDPFHVRTVNADNAVEEVDRSDELLQLVQKERLDAVISIVDTQALSILWKLNRKGLRTVCIPKSSENQVAATMLSFSFNSALSFAVETLDRVRQAAQSARKIGVVEVPGEHTGWLALELQRLTGHETYPLVLGQLVKAGAPTAVDRQLGLGYGAAAVRAIQENQTGVMVAFQPPDLKFVPLGEAINKLRTVPADSVFVQIARSLGISLGD
jgi:6-phosphofructokinase